MPWFITQTALYSLFPVCAGSIYIYYSSGTTMRLVQHESCILFQPFARPFESPGSPTGAESGANQKLKALLGLPPGHLASTDWDKMHDNVWTAMSVS